MSILHYNHVPRPDPEPEWEAPEGEDVQEARESIERMTGRKLTASVPE